MTISSDCEINYARIVLDDSHLFILNNYPNGGLLPLKYLKPRGFYTISHQALYSSRTYALGLRLENIDLKNKNNTYSLNVNEGRIINQPSYDDNLDLLVFSLTLPDFPKINFDQYSLIKSVWKSIHLILNINGIMVKEENNTGFVLPYCFKPLGGLSNGSYDFDNNNPLLPMISDETTYIKMVSAGGGGAGVDLNLSGHGTSGKDGGDMTLYMIEPDTYNFKPIVFLEGGFGGSKSVGAFDKIETNLNVTKDFIPDGYIYNDGNVEIEVISVIEPHHYPANTLTDVSGVKGYDNYGHSGNGGFVKDLGYRGGAGNSGATSKTRVRYKVNGNPNVGYLLFINPKVQLNTLGYLDKYLTVNKNSVPALAGQGGCSITDPGKPGVNGTLIVERNHAFR